MTGRAPCASETIQEAERNNAAVRPVRSERDTGRGGNKDASGVQDAERNNAADRVNQSPERNTGRGQEARNVPVLVEVDDLGSSTTRPVRVKKPIERLVVGDPQDPRFNRRK